MCEVAVATTGFFDGVHIGHRLVLQSVVSSARERGGEAIVFTFWPHPRTVLQQDARELRLLTSLEEKRSMLLSLGVDRVEVLPFSRDFAAMTAYEYISMLRDRYGVDHLVMGYDNRIGCDGLTFSSISVPGVNIVSVDALTAGGSVVREPVATLEYPKKACFFGDPTLGLVRGRGPANGWEGPKRSEGGSLTTVPPAVSSTVIRNLLSEGKVEEANGMLGYDYRLEGVVVAGNRMGRTIGFPTANMQLYEPLKLIPGNGVYAVEVEAVGGTFLGMCNIGTRPTVGGNVRTIETNIFDFDEDIYGLPIVLHMKKRLRSEVRFPSLEALKLQLEKDREEAIASFSDTL